MNGVTNTSWMIGGPQGSGVDSSATLFSRALAVAGYWVFGKREYHSNIKGKHSYFVVRANHEPVNSIIDAVHCLATFEDYTAALHDHEIVENGALIYDPSATKPETLNLHPSIKCYPMDYDGLVKEIAEELGKPAAKLSIVKNTISVAASLALYGVALEDLEGALKGLFTGRRSSLVEVNMKAAQKAYAVIQSIEGWDSFAYRLAPMVNKPAAGSRLIMNGAAASGMGKLLAGSRFQTYYSITPAVDECIFLEGKPDYGMIVYQGEDELSAMNMANGAAYTGARVSTATSGPGFCLMAEAIGWAGMNEVPVVIYNYMRGGPSTGLPTRNEQADILFACNIGHGDFPKIVLLPGDNHECFEDGFNCFNFAERYQMPVIVMPDKALANSTQTITPFETESLRIDRGKLVGAPESYNPADPSTGLTKLARFSTETEDGISERALPGTPGRIHFLTGDEHTEHGFITEEPAIRMANMEKRQRKLETALKEIPQQFQFKLIGPEDADVTLVGFGSSKGSIMDGMAALNKAGHSINYLHIRMMSPFPVDAVTAILKRAKKLIAIEANFSNQLAKLVRLETGVTIEHKVCKYTGRPITEDEVVDAVQQVLNNDARKVVLTHGH